jgi:hypothetical protein
MEKIDRLALIVIVLGVGNICLWIMVISLLTDIKAAITPPAQPDPAKGE